MSKAKATASLSTHSDFAAGLVELAPGISVPRRVTVTARNGQNYDDLPPGIEVRLDLHAVPGDSSRTGRYSCRSVTVEQEPDGPEVTSELIRALPIARLTRWAIVLEWKKKGETKNGWTEWSQDRLSDEDIARLKAAGPTEDTLKWVARSYRLALILGEPPTRAVERDLRVPRSTAGRWVALARERGHLGAAEGAGKAGG